MSWIWKQQGGAANDSVNVAPATGQAAMKVWYKVLLEAGWTRQGSSDGTSFDNTGATDYWAGALGNSSWVRMQDPAGVREIIVQRGTTNLLWREKWSHSAKFTGGTPSATVPPTATDEQNINGNNTPTFVSLLLTDNTYKIHVGANNASPYDWYMIMVPTGGGLVRSFYFLNLATGSYPSGDVAPYIVTANRDTMSNSGLRAISGGVELDGVGQGYYKKGLSGEAWVLFRGFGYGGSSVSDFTNGGAGVNPYDGDDNFVPIPVGRLAADGQGGWKGWIPIDVMNWPLSTRVDGDYADIDTDGDAVTDIRMAFFDDIAIRWPSGVIPVL